jgi:hypothetical protein
MVFSRDGKRLALTYGVAGAFGGSGSNRTMRLADKGEPVVTIHDLAGGSRAVTLTDDAPIVGVAFEGAGRLVATLGEDGNEDLWDAQTGARVATLINLVELGSFGAAEWLVVTPEGLFDGSPGAWQQIMWRFSANTFDVGPVEIFFNELYYPSLLSDIVAGKRPKAPRSLPQIDRRQPDVRLALASPPAAGDAAARTVAVSIDVAELSADTQHPQGSGAQDVRLFRNGTLTVSGILLSFSLSFVTQWANNPVPWMLTDLPTVVLLSAGIVFQIIALVRLLRHDSVEDQDALRRAEDPDAQWR